MKKSIALISLGCAKNLVNSEQMLYLLDEAGYALSPDPEGCDAVIINTCGFIDAAKSEAIDTILQMAELKAAGKLGKIIVTGCLPERYRDDIRAELPEIDAILGVGSFADIVSALDEAFAGNSVEYFGDKNAPVDELPRVVSTGPAWAYLKIAEGCDNFCAFCAIPYIRGRYRSRSMPNILEEARSLAEHGVKELIVIAQDITKYGTDLYGKRSLAELCSKLSEIDGIEWIRLHYTYPDQFDDELIDEIASNDKIVKYLDIPIQHINDGILRAMNRHGTSDDIRRLFKDLRQRIPGLVLRTSIIAGLPGEGEAEFEELCEFLREAKIERAGVFPFSPEEGTRAAKMEHVDFETAQRRAELIMQLQSEIMEEFCRSQVGKTLRVLCEGYDEEQKMFFGRSYADSPDIDGLVFFDGAGCEGNIVDVKITAITDECFLIGEEVDTFKGDVL
ncbi:MAG: 30S ribosomal protein S12 methylthiotransferase RimO [Oscillospiraceae bacterium]|nr:30S ribosomal protein S12 methylthiotransferase RimO [Oscillospiraceae bacterium]